MKIVAAIVHLHASFFVTQFGVSSWHF